MILLHAHVRKQMEKRGISENDVREAVEHGDVIIEEHDPRFGLKRYSKTSGIEGDLIVIWFYTKTGDQHIVTAYWRRART